MSRHKVMDPLLPRTGVAGDKLVLVLDNGVRIETGGVNGPGAYVLVANREGDEIGYWNAEEWAKDPSRMMATILGTAALGREPVGRASPTPTQPGWYWNCNLAADAQWTPVRVFRIAHGQLGTIIPSLGQDPLPLGELNGWIVWGERIEQPAPLKGDAHVRGD